MILSSIQNVMIVVSILAAVSIVLTEYLSKLTKLNGFAAQVQSWVVSIILASIANVLGLGFGNVNLFTDLLCGLLVGLVANGTFNIPLTKTILTWIKARI